MAKEGRLSTAARHKADLLLVCLLLGITGTVFAALSAARAEGERVVITVDGAVYGTYALFENRRIPIADADGHVGNTAVIEDRSVYMETADCPDRLCVRQGSIDRTMESIVCLPHRVVITISGAEEAEYDGIVQ